MLIGFYTRRNQVPVITICS